LWAVGRRSYDGFGLGFAFIGVGFAGLRGMLCGRSRRRGFTHGFLDRGGFVGLVMMFEEAVIALESAFGGGFVAKHQIVRLNLTGIPAVCGAGFERGQKIVIVALSAETIPLRLRRSENEIKFERVFLGLVGVAPVTEKEFPVSDGLVREDEGSRTGAVFDGVFRRGGAACR
jgi:hypothetical protein